MARFRRRQDVLNGALTPPDALHVLIDAERLGYVAEWEMRVGTDSLTLTYSAVVVFRNRKKDGSVGRRRGEIWYSGIHPSPERIVVLAAQKIAATCPEVPL